MNNFDASLDKLPEYKVYALKYAGPLPRKLAMVRWLQGFDVDIKYYYYIWAIQDEQGNTILFDTGTSVAFGKELKEMVERYKITNYVDPREIVAQLGVDPDKVTKVIISHLHFDHVGGMVSFPESYKNAKFYVQKSEYDFWIKNPIAQRLPFLMVTDPEANKALAGLEGSPRLSIVDGDQVICPGIELLLVPGHTPGLQAVRVNTAKGPLILASDCAHSIQSFKDDVPSCLIFNMEVWMHSYDKLREKAPVEMLFAGHDNTMIEDYPHITEDITQLA